MRPTKIFKGTTSPLRNANHGDLDWLIIRENSEGEYAGHGGRSHVGQPWETATETAVFTRHGVERLMRFAFQQARLRKSHLTVVTKSNAQRNGMVMWDEVAEQVGKEFEDVRVDKMLVDAMTCRMVLEPGSLDTIVATNLVSISVPFCLFTSFCIWLPLEWHNGISTGKKFTDRHNLSTPISYPIWQPPWQAALASHQQAIVSLFLSALHSTTTVCSSGGYSSVK